MRVLSVVLALALAGPAVAQFEILDAKTTASLRGIDALSAQVAWASGSGGTVLLTTDGGANWKHCAVPPGAEKLDFRGVQAFDAQIAFVMASGKGPASAVYKTTDGCATWKLVFADPDAEGFFDNIARVPGAPDRRLCLMGDPVGGKFQVFCSGPDGLDWKPYPAAGLEAPPGAGGFAASNSGLVTAWSREGTSLSFGTGATETQPPMFYSTASCRGNNCGWNSVAVPLAAGGSSSGIFSLTLGGSVLVAVGGNYSKPADTAGTAAFSPDWGKHWQPAQTMPSGYRSAVVYDAAAKMLIAVGPNGCDVSNDGGRNWMPLQPGTGDTPNADKNWNAISLPFAVGSKGKIGKLKAGVLGK